MNMILYAMALAGWMLVMLISVGAALGGLLYVARLLGTRRGTGSVPAPTAGAVLLTALITPLATLGAVALGDITPSLSARIVGEAGRVGEALLATGTTLGTGYDHMDGVVAIAVSLWVMAALVGVARTVATARVHRAIITQQRYSARCAGEMRLAQTVERLASGLHLPRVPRVAVAGVDGPLVIGWRSPLIVVPAHTFTTLRGDELEAVLLHELAHVRRRDYVSNIALELLRAVFWPSAAVWLGVRILREERERECDLEAVRRGARPLALARALVALEERRAVRESLALPASASPLGDRVHRLLNPDHPVGSSRASAVAVVMLTVVLLPLGVLAAGESAHLAEAAAHARRPIGHTMQVNASDPAGSFTLDVANGTLVAATVNGAPVARYRLEQRGDSLAVREGGGVVVIVTMTAEGGVEWQARERR